MRSNIRRRIALAVATGLLVVPPSLWVVHRFPAASHTLPVDGVDQPMSVTPLLVLEEESLTLQEPPVAGVPDTIADQDASPQWGEGPPLTAPLPSPVAALPPPEPSRSHHVSPPRGSIAAELERRVRGDLHRLNDLEDNAASPLGRLATLFTFLEQQHCAGGACQAVQRVTETYMHARTALIRNMLEAFLASDGVDNGAREHQALQTLHADFIAEIATLAAHVPMLARLPDILATTFHVPDYLEAPEDDTTRQGN